MTLKQAIESGKPFKRKCWSGSSWIKTVNDEFVGEDGTVINLRPYSVLVDDWETKEEAGLPRVYAHICTKSSPEYGFVIGELTFTEVERLSLEAAPYFRRAPWLDEPAK